MEETYYILTKYTVSRGIDTYGYNICTLWDSVKNIRLGKCSGGGYCMKGVAFAEWMSKNFMPEISLLDPKEYYGISKLDSGKVYLEGASGIDCMYRILQGIGFTIERTLYQKQGDIIGHRIHRVKA